MSLILDPTADLTWRTLSNGAKVLMVPSTSNSIVAATVFFPLPGAVESPKEAGVLSFMLRMLMRGTRRRSNAEVAEANDGLGTNIGCDLADDYSYAQLVATSDSFEQSLELLAEIIQQPAFEPEEIEKERQSTLAAIRRSEDDLFSLTMQNWLRELYGDHGYGLPGKGYQESVGEFTREQIKHVHEEILEPSQYRIVIVGNFDSGATELLLERLFPASASREGTEHTGITVALPEYRTGGRSRVTRECEQAYLVCGYPACPSTHPDWAAVRALNAVLGEGMSSRLFLKLRDEQGLAYATGSGYGALKLGGHLYGYIGTKPESLQTARDGMLEQFEQVKNDLVPADELTRAKNYVIGKFLIDHQTNGKRSFYLGHFEMTGAGIWRDHRFADLIAAVTPEQVQEAARKYLKEATIAELVPQGT